LGWWIADVLKGHKISALAATGGILAGEKIMFKGVEVLWRGEFEYANNENLS
jgi:hypothetical protein